MGIFELAAALGRALKEDERLVRLEEARKAYEADPRLARLATEYEVQQKAIQNEAMKEERDQTLITMIQDRIDAIYTEIVESDSYKALEKAQNEVNDLMEMVKEELAKHPAGGLVYGAWVGGIPGVWWWQRKDTCGGQLVEQNIHLLDGLRWLYGEPLSVYATCSRGINKPGERGVLPEYDTDDHSTAVIRFPNNVTATLVSACYSKTVRPRCGLYITLEDVVLDYRLRNNLIVSTAEGSTDTPRRVDQTYLLDRAFIDALKTGDRSLIRSDYEDALKTHKLAFAANRSMETGEVIYFDR